VFELLVESLVERKKGKEMKNLSSFF